jgi:hypothetical protein
MVAAQKRPLMLYGSARDDISLSHPRSGHFTFMVTKLFEPDQEEREVTGSQMMAGSCGDPHYAKRPPKSAGAFKLIVWHALAGSGTSNVLDVAAVNAEVAKFAIGHTAKFGDRPTVLAPVIESACYIHDDPLSWAFETQLPVLGASVVSMSMM